ncbi:MAG: MlaD family protein [Marinilabiliaceae bacterium]|nr:MlaD family protein [Marinilabiliaceae bacterium]
MKGRNFFQNSNNYYGRYHRVDGLNVGSPIYYKGYKIGSVRKIEFDPKNSSEFLVTFSLTKELPITNRTVAQLYSMDLMGSKAIQFINSDGFIFHDAEELHPGDTLKTSIMGDLKDQVSTEVLPLKDKVENLIVKLDTVLTNISSLFTAENKSNLNLAIKHFYSTVASLERSAYMIQYELSDGGSINQSLINIEDFTAQLKMQGEVIDDITSNFKDFTGQLNDANFEGIVSKLDSTLFYFNNLLEKASSGEGSIGLLMEDETLYHNLTDASANLDRLLANMRHHPNRYVNFSAVNFGRKVYMNPDEKTAQEQGIVYKVKVAESSNPLVELKNKKITEQLMVKEDYDGKNFVYSVGETHSYNEALAIMDKIYDSFPNAAVIALQNGKQLSLKKALKKSEP